MKLTILYDNNARNPFKSGWGFSCLIESSKKKILFDTGWNADILVHNMRIAGIKPEEINKIVISHPDWDHIGCLNYMLKHAEADVYLTKSVSNNLKNEIKCYANVIEVSEAQKISKDVWTTGELGEEIKEQSLVINTQKGNIIITGCAHPGLEAIIEKSKEMGDIHAIIGGFHDSNTQILKGIPVVIPCHCTEDIEKIKKELPGSFRECYVGFVLKISD